MSADHWSPADRAVLVHGGMHTASCWDPVIPHMNVEATAINLPGRPGAGSRPVSLDGWTDTVAEAVSSGPGGALVVAHSLGALSVLPAISEVASRVSGVLLIATVVPASGQCYWDLVPKISRRMGRVWRHGQPYVLMPRPIARHMLAHDLTAGDRERLYGQMVPEPDAVLAAPVAYEVPPDIPITYLHTLHDRVVTPRKQRGYVSALPRATREESLDCGHSATYSRPKDVASVINRLARQGGAQC